MTSEHAAYVVNGAIVKEMGRNDLLDDLVKNLLAELLGRNLLGVLSRNDDGVNTERDGGATVLLVLDGDLGLGVRAEPWESTCPPCDGESGVELVSQDDGQWHVLLGLIGSVAEHDTLVTGTEVLEGTVVETLSDIGRLLLNGNENVAGLVIEALGGVIVANLLNGLTDDLLEVDGGLGCDFAKDHDHAGLGGGLTSDLGEWVLRQASIELENGKGNFSQV